MNESKIRKKEEERERTRPTIRNKMRQVVGASNEVEGRRGLAKGRGGERGKPGNQRRSKEECSSSNFKCTWSERNFNLPASYKEVI